MPRPLPVRPAIFYLALLLAALLAACSLPGEAPAGNTPAAISTTRTEAGPSPMLAASPTESPSATASPTLSATATPPATPQPRLVAPEGFVRAQAARLAALRQAQPGLVIEQVADTQAALKRLAEGGAAWAVLGNPNPISALRPLCLTPYVAIVHFSSPLEDLPFERIRQAYLGREWGGPVYYAGDQQALASILNLEQLAPRALALPTWADVVSRVAGDRAALAFVPWSAVDARVKTLSLDGRSISGGDAYSYGDQWWLTLAQRGQQAAYDDIVKTLACPPPNPLTFRATGDVLMGWFVHDIYVSKEGPEYPFRRVRDLLRSADITFVDFENPIAAQGPENRGLVFGAAPQSVKGLTYAGVDVVNLANNHMGDYGPQGVLDTMSVLRQAGIGWAGAGRNQAEARSPWITATKGVTVALLAFNQVPPAAYAADASNPGTAWTDAGVVVAEVKKAKAQGAFVIVSLHWGIEYTAHPNAGQQQLARSVAEAGADLIIGGHPHVIQALGFVGKTYVDYSLGDFIYVQPGSPATGEAIVLSAVIEDGQLKQIQQIPVYIDRAQPYLMSAVEAKMLLARRFDAARVIDGLPARQEAAPTPPPAMTLAGDAQPKLAGQMLASAVSGARSDIVVVGGGGVSAPFTHDGLLNDNARLSPDGRRVVYSSARNGNVDLYVAAAGGSNATNVTHSPAWDDYPSWSPDGTQLVFASNRDGPWKIFTMSADGAKLRKLTDGGAWDTMPAWSPDGTRIAFASDRGYRFQIYTINADGSGLRAVTTHPHSSYFPAWSPDGRWLVYQTYRDESALRDDDAIQDRDYELFISSAAGGPPRQLTDNRFADVQPAWSPDGKHIAFASDRSGSFQIWQIDAAGGDARAITSGPGAYMSPAWGR